MITQKLPTHKITLLKTMWREPQKSLYQPERESKFVRDQPVPNQTTEVTRIVLLKTLAISVQLWLDLPSSYLNGCILIFRFRLGRVIRDKISGPAQISRPIPR